MAFEWFSCYAELDVNRFNGGRGMILFAIGSILYCIHYIYYYYLGNRPIPAAIRSIGKSTVFTVRSKC